MAPLLSFQVPVPVPVPVPAEASQSEELARCQVVAEIVLSGSVRVAVRAAPTTGYARDRATVPSPCARAKGAMRME